MTNTTDAEIDPIRQKIVDILGLETDPDGLPEYLLVRDEAGNILEGSDWHEETDELVNLVTNEVSAANSLLKRWMEAFDDDGNLDGYNRQYIKQLQKNTYVALSSNQKEGTDNERPTDNSKNL